MTVEAALALGVSWHESPVTHVDGSLADIASFLPEFERRPFAASQPGGMKTRLNERYDMIVRKPFQDDPDYVPVGIVSKTYALVPHHTVLNTAVNALKLAKIPVGGITADLDISQYGERMRLSLYLPPEYDFAPADGHRMKLRLECLNSVDGSSRFRALMSWLRQICSNGLTTGVNSSLLQRRHAGDMDFGDVSKIIDAGIKEAQEDQKLFNAWHKFKVKGETLTDWIENSVQKTWGFKAAARVYHISQTGCDADIIPAFEKQRPSSAKIKKGRPVPGCPEKATNLFDINQILAWLAKERRDVQERLQWREQIPGLMEKLAA